MILKDEHKNIFCAKETSLKEQNINSSEINREMELQKKLEKLSNIILELNIKNLKQDEVINCLENKIQYREQELNEIIKSKAWLTVLRLRKSQEKLKKFKGKIKSFFQSIKKITIKIIKFITLKPIKFGLRKLYFRKFLKMVLKFNPKLRNKLIRIATSQNLT